MVVFPTAWQGAGGGAGLSPRAAAPAWRSMPLPFTRYLSGGNIAGVSFSRGSKANGPDLPLTDFADNMPRFDAAGMLVGEGGRTQYLAYARGEGAAAGTPGTRPPGWTVSSTTGITREILEPGVADGVPYFRSRFYGTPASNTILLISPQADGAIAAAEGDKRCATVLARLAGGSLANCPVRALLRARGPASSTVISTLSAYFVPTEAPLGSLRPRVAGIMPANTGFVQQYVGLDLTAGSPIDITLDLGGWQLEDGMNPSSLMLPAPGAPAAVTRAGDRASIPIAGSAAGGVACNFMVPFIPATGGDPLILLQLDGGSDGDRMVFWVEPGGALNAFVVTGSFNYFGTLGTVAAGVIHAMAMNWDVFGVRALMRDGNGQQGFGGAPSSRSTLRLMNRADWSQGGFCRMGPVDIYAAAPDLPMALAALPR